MDDESLVEYIPYNILTKQQAIKKMKSKLPKSITNEAARKAVQEKEKIMKELEAQLGIKHDDEQEEQKKEIRLTDVKDAVKVNLNDRNATLEEGEHKFIYRRGKGNGLRSKYGLN